MDEGMDVRDHINKINKRVIQLLGVKVQIDEEYQTIILLASLPKSFQIVVTTLLIGKTMLIMDKVSSTLLKTKNIKQLSNLSHTR